MVYHAGQAMTLKMGCSRRPRTGTVLQTKYKIRQGVRLLFGGQASFHNTCIDLLALLQ